MTKADGRGPFPLGSGDAQIALDAAAGGADWKAALELTLSAIPPGRAESLMLLLREGRGAWALFARAAGGRALFIGNALSGTPVALARLGFDVTVLDDDPERLALGALRATALAGGAIGHVLARGGPRLCFEDGAFALAAHEGGWPASGSTGDVPASGPGLGPKLSELGPKPAELRLSELARVAREVVVVADNRLGYKTSRGRRGEFLVPGPLAYARRALRPRPGSHTLSGWRRALDRAGLGAVQAFALYPHSGEFAQVVALSGDGPELFVGPLERRNRAKVWAARAGLFPWLTPSYAFVGRTRDSERSRENRLARIVGALAEQLGEPQPIVEHVVATRGNAAVVHTHRAGADPEDPCGRWTLHVPLSPCRARLVRRHAEGLEHLRAEHPAVPVPEPLFRGSLDGLELSCERRLPGFSASQLAGDPARAARCLEDVTDHLIALVDGEERSVDGELCARLFDDKLQLARGFVRDPRTARALDRLGLRVRALILGRPIRTAYLHADLRSKHVQVRPDGRVVGLLDWSSAVADDLPYFDLLNLVAQGRKQREGAGPARAWQVAREPERLAEWERAPLDRYAARTDLDDGVRRAIELAYPVLVSAQAERTWDYSRPDWLHRQYRPDEALSALP